MAKQNHVFLPALLLYRLYVSDYLFPAIAMVAVRVGVVANRGALSMTPVVMADDGITGLDECCNQWLVT